MFLLFEILAAVSAGAFITIILYSLLNRTPKPNETKTEKTSIKLSFSSQDMLSKLAENPKSKESRKIKLTISVIIFFVFIVLIGKFMFALLFAILTFFGIGAYYNNQIKKKMDVFENQLVEVLGMIANSVKAGQSLTQALENMIKDTKPPISVKFEEALRQVKLGKPLNQALLEMAETVDSKDLKMSVRSINLARETGGNLGEILTSIANTIRERKKIRGKIEALTAQGKISGITMGIVPFALLGILYLMEPVMMSLLFTTLAGNAMLFTAVVMIVIGMFFINKIVSIDI